MPHAQPAFVVARRDTGEGMPSDEMMYEGEAAVTLLGPRDLRCLNKGAAALDDEY